jgi:hypothetical protein
MRNNLERSICRIHPAVNEQQWAAYGNELPHVTEHWNVPVSGSEKLMSGRYSAYGRVVEEGWKNMAKVCWLVCGYVP